MSTTKQIRDLQVWDEVCMHVFPAGIPPDPSFEAELRVCKFIGGWPDGLTKVSSDPLVMELHWDHDFSAEEEKQWARIMRFCRRQVAYEDEFEAEVEPFIEQMKAWRNRGANEPTMDNVIDTLDAVVEYIRLTYKEDIP